MNVIDVFSSVLISVKCLGWDRVAWTGQPVNFCRAGANQTLPSSTQIGLSVLPLAFVRSVLHSWRLKPPVPARPLLPLNTQRCECCLLCHPPLPSLWGRKHFDRTVFTACWSVGMNHEKNQIIWLEVHLYWVLVSCVVLRVWPIQIEEGECVSQWKISPRMCNKWVAYSVFIICLCLCGWHSNLLVSVETLFPSRKMKPVCLLKRIHVCSSVKISSQDYESGNPFIIIEVSYHCYKVT